MNEQIDAPDAPAGWSWGTRAAAALILAGALLRLFLFAANPPMVLGFPGPVLPDGRQIFVVYPHGRSGEVAYDRHFPVSAFLLRHGQLPIADEAWEAYQPPLYHILGAGAYVLAAQQTRIPEQWWVSLDHIRRRPGNPDMLEGLAPTPWMAAQLARTLAADYRGRRAAQGISLLAGIILLPVCWLILKRLFPGRALPVLSGLAFACFLPRPIYMSAMATNDSLAYLAAAVTLYCLLRLFAAPGERRWYVWTGFAAGLALLTKHYNLALLPALLAGLLVLWRREGREFFPAALPRLAALGFLLVLLGSYPFLRPWKDFGRPLISNAEIFRDEVPIADYPPGPWQGVSWLDLRLEALLWRPFLHVDHLDSLPTELYARLYFDYEPVFTLWRYPFFQAFDRWCRQAHRWSRAEYWRRRLSWPDAEHPYTWMLDYFPPTLATQARALYLAGLVPLFLVLVGAGLLAARAPADPARAALVTLLAAALALLALLVAGAPYFCSMKAAYLLAALPCLAAACGRGAEALRERWPVAGPVLAVGALALLAVASAWHFLYLATVNSWRLPGVGM